MLRYDILRIKMSTLIKTQPKENMSINDCFTKFYSHKISESRKLDLIEKCYGVTYDGKDKHKFRFYSQAIVSVIDISQFKKKYKGLIKILAKIQTDSDIIKMIIKIINTNQLFEKEIRKSTLEKSDVIDFFIKPPDFDEIYNTIINIYETAAV